MHADSGRKPFLSLIIPAYNERDRLASTLITIEAYMSSFRKSYEIIIVDDGSSDGMLDMVRQQAKESGTVRLVRYEQNQGKGYAIRQGVAVARGDYIAFSDADLSAPIDELPKLFDAIKDGNDVAICSRAIKGAVLEVRQPLYRELGGKALNLAIRTFAVRGIHDTQCGFKLFRGKAAHDIFKRCFINGWSFDIEALYLARKLGYEIAEVPVKWHHSEGSKIHPFSAGVHMLMDLIKIRRYNYRIR